MDLGLRDRVALVSAASSGLGLAAARSLAGEGAHVAICGRDGDRLSAARAEILAATGAGGSEVWADQVDLRNPAAVAAWVHDVAGRRGRLDVVVTNTGGVPFGPLEQFGVDDVRDALEDNLLPAVGLALTALPHLQASDAGRLLMMTSEAVRQPSRTSGLSSVARLGLLGVAKGLVDPLGASGATVNVVAPGYHRTPILDVQFGDAIDEHLTEVAETLPVRRIGDVEDLGAVVSFLAGRHAGSITGTVVLVDGGKTKGI